MPVNGAQLEVPERQIPVAPDFRLVDEHVRKAVHRLDAVGLFVDFRKVHVLAIVVEMPRALPEIRLEERRSPDDVVAPPEVFALLEGFQYMTQDRTPGMVDHHPGPHLVTEAEKIQFPAQLPVVPPLGFFQEVEILLEAVLVGKGRSVYALEHGVLFVAPPVGPCHTRQLERLEVPGVRHVRPPAEVHEVALPVRGNLGVLEPFQQFDLVLLTPLTEVPDGLLPGHLPPLEGMPARRQFPHLLFYLFEIFLGERALDVKIVVEPVFDGRPDGDLRFGEQGFHGLGHDVRRAVAQNFSALGRGGLHPIEGRCLPDRRR